MRDLPLAWPDGRLIGLNGIGSSQQQKDFEPFVAR
jgi:hypothetical protein